MKLNNIFSFYLIFASILLVCVLIINDYGITGDAEIQKTYGNYVWDYIKHLGQPTKTFETYHPDKQEIKYYGGLFDGISALIIDVFKAKNEFYPRHLINAFFGLLGILFSGLIMQHITQSWTWAILGLFFASLLPRYFGEMFSNPKDIPFAAGYIVAIFYIQKFINEFERPKWTTIIGLALGIAISVGVRIGGILVIAYFGFAYLLQVFLKYRSQLSALKTSIVRAFIAVSIGYLIAIFWWPYAHSNPIANPLEALSVMSSYPLSISMLFEGMRINTAEMPSSYLIKWLWIGNPLFILFGLLPGVFFLIREIFKNKSIEMIILLIAMCFPVAYIIHKKSVVYDGLRHIIFILPIISVVSCYGYFKLYNNLSSKISRYAFIIFLILLMFLPLKHMIKNHPNQYVYFNEIFGGVNKAFGYYETDYYHMSGKKAADWVKENVLKNANGKIKILSNMGTQYLYYQNMDTGKVSASYGRWRERDHLDWDYYVAYSRFIEPENLQNGVWPPGKVIHTIKVDDIPVCVVMQRLNKDDIDAYTALNSGDMTTAASLYQKNLSIDNSNEYTWFYYSIALANTGRINEAIEAIKTAIQLNSSNPEWTNQLQKYYQIYSSANPKR